MIKEIKYFRNIIKNYRTGESMHCFSMKAVLKHNSVPDVDNNTASIKNMKITGKKILITGGATGLGLGLTGRFIQDNNSVIICGRREYALKAASDRFPSIIAYRCDLSVPAEREDLFKWISENHNDLKVLVNNAGIQQRMTINDKVFYLRAKEEITINIEAPVHLTSLFLKLDSLDTIINVTSGLSFVPLTTVAVYSATKSFLHSFTLSLRHLLKPKRIEIIEIIPPGLNTDLGGKGVHDRDLPVDTFIAAIFEQLEEGRNELTYGFVENMLQSGPAGLKRAFDRMNPSE